MNELLKMLLEMMEDGMSDTKDKKEDATKSSEEGEFKSLVPDKEVKYWEDMNNDFKKYMDEVHIPNIISHMNGSDLTAKQLVHYMVYLDFITDLVRTLNCLATVNEAGVKAIEEVHNEKGVSYKSMAMDMFLNSVLVEGKSKRRK